MEQIQKNRSKRVRGFCQWLAVAILFCGISMNAQAQLKKGHFFKVFDKENVTIENAEQCFDQWFSLPVGTEWRQVGNSTDDLGMSRIEYRQYVYGIEVEHSQVLLHARDGKVSSANGTVMEQEQYAGKAFRGSPVNKANKLTSGQEGTVCLIEIDDSYRYVYKTLSADLTKWLYTDLESGELLKSLPTIHCLTKPEGAASTVTGKSIYSGDVTLDVTKTADGKTWLYDQKRNIHTLLGAYLPTYTKIDAENLTDKYFPDPKNVTDISTYLFDGENSSYINNDGSTFSAYKLNKITITKANLPDGSQPTFLSYIIRYGMDDPNKPVSLGLIEDASFSPKTQPIEIDLSNYQEVMPREGVTIDLRGLDLSSFSYFKLATISIKPDDSGTYSFNNDYITATITYEPSGDPVADIHWGMGKTYDFYKEVFNRDSYDNKGAPIYNYAYVTESNDSTYLTCRRNSAGAVGVKPYPMVYGMGGYNQDNTNFYLRPVVELSVMSHEFTHIVTDHTANLLYEGESGALNESFSDLMGISCKKWVEGNNSNWYIGDKGLVINRSNLRDMSNPKNNEDGKDPGPDTYKGENWGDTSDTSEENDYGCVHMNSGVQNKWFYLLTDGGQGTNDTGYSYQVTGIGIEESRMIAYRTLVQYAIQKSQYADIRLASIQAAKDLYPTGPEADAVAKAWDAVGVYENGVMPTAINDVSRDTESDDRYYDLQGRRISHPDKGIYILNNKKIIK